MHTPFLAILPKRWMLFAALLSVMIALPGAAFASAVKSSDPLSRESCLKCHENKHDKIKVPVVIDGEEDERELRSIDKRKFAKSVHSQMQCLDCHKNIVDARKDHQLDANAPQASCIGCHEDLWAKAQQEGKTKDKPRLGVVFQNIEAYNKSFHARENKDIPGTPLAKCDDCHSSHDFDVPPQESERRTAWHKSIPETCGQCHADQLDIWGGSVHGEEVIDKGNLKAAVCTDCHSAHSVTGTSGDSFKLSSTGDCGTCHKEELKSFHDTYHGQVSRLGYAYTARCVSCHDSHGIKAVADPQSTVHPDNRLKTCQSCHDGKKLPLATGGFSSFHPHANTHDFEKYPVMYVTSKFMIWLLVGVFAFFWLHSGLWYYREWQDRKAGKHHHRIDTTGLNLDEEKMFVERFHWGWRLAHLVFALSTMALVLTGTTALFAHSDWAPVVAKALGGPQVLGIIHRVAAGLFVGIFLIHFIYVLQKLLRDKTFEWFGPDSLVPNWKDLDDMIGMFKWFLGKGERPKFERWAYYEKFDYWAVFWGVNVIGWSGLMLAIPHVTAEYLPGWAFNVATLVHAEEAFLAAVFLFTVHFFNNHFRPDKLPPPDIVMFTGTQSLREFRHDHPAQYQRLVDSGELTKRLVSAPSPAMKKASVALGLLLITVGLMLLVLIGTGFFSG
ncbi:MAG: cytochrome c3 family protein [Rhodocyclaceae bacterium]|nr:cytochrome c3 family protein [Rhodocyclaceae bacterium]